MPDAPSLPSLPSLLAELASLCGSHRFLTLSLDSPAGAPAPDNDAQLEHLRTGILAIEALAAVDGMHALGCCDVLLLSSNAHLPLKHFISRRATVSINGNGTLPTRMSGLVQEAAHLGSEGGLARYRIRLVPWIWLLSQSSTSRVWQDATLVDIVEDIFRTVTAHAAWRWTAEALRFLQQARPRPYTVQYRETDLAFVSRLLAEEGITWRIEQSDDDSAPCGHVLVLLTNTSDVTAIPEDATSAGLRPPMPGNGQDAGLAVLAPGGIRTGTSHGTLHGMQPDCIGQLSVTTVLQPTLTTVLSPDYEARRSVAATAPASSDVRLPHGPPIERYDPNPAHAWRSAASAQHYANLMQQAVDARVRRLAGSSTVRSLRAGTRMRIAPSVEVTALMGHAPELTLLRVVSCAINNLPRPAQQAIDRLLGSQEEILAHCLKEVVQHSIELSGIRLGGVEDEPSEDAPSSERAAIDEPIDAGTVARLIAQARAAGAANCFDAVPASVVWRPVLADGTGLRWRPRATAPGSQVAIVVGMQGETVAQGASEVCCDRLGRVRIRFPWQDSSHDSIGSTGMQYGHVEAGQRHASCWVRVAQRAAGLGMGWRFLPRIGQEVLVQFIDGDIERPVIVGALYNGCGQGGVARTPGGPAGSAPAAEAYARAHDHAPSAQGNLAHGGNLRSHSPVWHGGSADAAGHRNAAAQWGIRSKEHGGTGYNQLVFDDTDRQGRIQMKTTCAGTELNLGHLIHTADNYRGSFRGTGAELRTDAYGAIRAGAGLVLSTYGKRQGAKGRDAAGENAAGMAHLQQASDLLAACSQAALHHRTVALAAHTGTVGSKQSVGLDAAAPAEALRQAASGMVSRLGSRQAHADAARRNTAPSDESIPHTAAPMIAIAGKAGLALLADGGMDICSGDAAIAAAGGDMQTVAAGQWRLHAGQAIGMLAGAMQGGKESNGQRSGTQASEVEASDGQTIGKRGLDMIAAQGDVTLQAQAGTMGLRARRMVDVKSAHRHIDWAAARKITLQTAGGATIVIENGNITVACPG